MIIDIDIPRNADPESHRLPGVHLCNIGDLRAGATGLPDAGRDDVRRESAG